VSFAVALYHEVFILVTAFSKKTLVKAGKIDLENCFAAPADWFFYLVPLAFQMG
jgi:hypothetical protein